MDERHSRTALVIGAVGIEKLKNSRVAVIGLGGVGGACAEALARAGVGELTLIDKDRVDESNLNRQTVALYSTVGRYKTDVMAERISDLFRECKVNKKTLFYLPETAGEVPLEGYDYIADCIDNVTAKLCLIEAAKRAGVPVISAMGAGNRLFPERIRISDIEKTSVCPLARTVRRELKKRGVRGVDVAWSDEEPVASGETVGSVSFVPPAMGFVMAGKIVRELIK